MDLIVPLFAVSGIRSKIVFLVFTAMVWTAPITNAKAGNALKKPPHFFAINLMEATTTQTLKISELVIEDILKRCDLYSFGECSMSAINGCER